MEQVDVNKVHEELIDEIAHELFGSTHKPAIRMINKVKRSIYTRAMNKVQDKYGLKQGHPQFLEWVFTCVGHSPIIVEDEGEDTNE